VLRSPIASPVHVRILSASMLKRLCRHVRSGPAFAYSTGATSRSGRATLHRGAHRGEAVQIVNRAKADPAYSDTFLTTPRKLQMLVKLPM
jgi:hypothetical protein